MGGLGERYRKGAKVREGWDWVIDHRGGDRETLNDARDKIEERSNKAEGEGKKRNRNFPIEKKEVRKLRLEEKRRKRAERVNVNAYGRKSIKKGKGNKKT